jgi:hypothetical protein
MSAYRFGIAVLTQAEVHGLKPRFQPVNSPGPYVEFLERRLRYLPSETRTWRMAMADLHLWFWWYAVLVGGPTALAFIIMKDWIDAKRHPMTQVRLRAVRPRR